MQTKSCTKVLVYERPSEKIVEDLISMLQGDVTPERIRELMDCFRVGPVDYEQPIDFEAQVGMSPEEFSDRYKDILKLEEKRTSTCNAISGAEAKFISNLIKFVHDYCRKYGIYERKFDHAICYKDLTLSQWYEMLKYGDRS